MKNNPGTRHRGRGQIHKLVGSQDKGGLKLISESNNPQDSPDRTNVVSMLRHGVGSVLEGLNEASGKVQDAKRLHEIAASVGDKEVEAMIGHELRRVEEAARVA